MEVVTTLLGSFLRRNHPRVIVCLLLSSLRIGGYFAINLRYTTKLMILHRRRCPKAYEENVTDSAHSLQISQCFSQSCFGLHLYLWTTRTPTSCFPRSLPSAYSNPSILLRSSNPVTERDALTAQPIRWHGCWDKTCSVKKLGDRNVKKKKGIITAPCRHVIEGQRYICLIRLLTKENKKNESIHVQFKWAIYSSCVSPTLLPT